jgi:hypothetical protein
MLVVVGVLVIMDQRVLVVQVAVVLVVQQMVQTVLPILAVAVVVLITLILRVTVALVLLSFARSLPVQQRVSVLLVEQLLLTRVTVLTAFQGSRTVCILSLRVLRWL